MSTESVNLPTVGNDCAPRSDSVLSHVVRWFSETRIAACGLLLAVLVLYAPTLHFGFLNWDDSWYILWNDLIKSWHPANLYGILTEPVARNYAPLTIGTYLVEYTLWQTWPGGYHVTNVALHALNAVLVFQLVRQLTRNSWLAWMAAALFAVHPVQVEAVAWISSRKTLLSSTFSLASLICWLRPDRTSKQEGWGCLWLALGLLSKASTVVVPPIVIVYDVFVVRRKWADSISRQIVPMFFCALLVFTTMQAQVTIVGGVRKHIGMSKLELLAIDTTLLWRYIGMLLWPQNLCVLYDPPTRGIWLQVMLASLGWGVVAVWMWQQRQKHPLVLLAGIAWILLFVPVLNLFPLTTLMNDRYLYLPCVPFFALLAGVLQGAWNEISSLFPGWKRIRNSVAVAASSLVIAITAWGTLNYLPVWQGPYSLWNYARFQTPTLAVVQIQWAITLESLGRYSEAADALRYALEHCEPDAPDEERIRKMLQALRTTHSAGNVIRPSLSR